MEKARRRKMKVGEGATDFILKDDRGNEFRLGENKGK